MKALILLTVFAFQQPQPQLPPLLAQTLKKLPDVRLSVSGSHPAWLVQDVDRDKRPDVVAVVVSATGAREFGVIAVHARNPEELH